MTVYPLDIQLGPMEITGYGIMMAVGFLMAGWCIQLKLKERGLSQDYAADIVVGAVIGGIVGAKLWYVAITGNPGALFSRAGLVWYGGLVGGAAGVLFNGWRKRVPARLTLDLCAPALALGYALGRVGCFLVGDDYGRPTTLPWGIRFPEGEPPTTVAELQQFGVATPPDAAPFDVLAVHPTQLYEVVVMFGVFTLLWRLRRHGHATGWLFGLYLVCAGAERFLVEFVRAKDDRFIGSFTVAQAASVALVLLGVYLVQRWRRAEDAPPLDLSALAPAAPTSR